MKRFIIACAILILAAAAGSACAFVKAKFDRVQTCEDPVYVTSETDAPDRTPEPARVTEPDEKDDRTDYTNPDDLFEFYIFGVDSRDNTTLSKGTNSDTNIICQVNLSTGEIRMISVLRDTLMEAPNGKRNKINGIYCRYGAAEAAGAINLCTDLSIPRFVTVNWKTVVDVIDQIGGIDVYLSSAEVKNINLQIVETSRVTGVPSEAIRNVGDGIYHLNGVQAVGHARDRQVGKYDVERTRRQRDMLAAALAAVKTLPASRLNDIADTALSGVLTNLTVSDILNLIPLIKKANVTVTECYPFGYRMQSGGMWYVYPDSVATNAMTLHALLYPETAYEPSDRLKEIDAFVSKYALENP